MINVDQHVVTEQVFDGICICLKLKEMQQMPFG